MVGATLFHDTAKKKQLRNTKEVDYENVNDYVSGCDYGLSS